MCAYIFLHPTARTRFDDWEGQLRICVTRLRALSTLERDAPDLGAIVGELILKSSHFAGLWRRYDVHGHTRGHKDLPPSRSRRPPTGPPKHGSQRETRPGPDRPLGRTRPPEHDAITLLDRSDADHIRVLEVRSLYIWPVPPLCPRPSIIGRHQPRAVWNSPALDDINHRPSSSTGLARNASVRGSIPRGGSEIVWPNQCPVRADSRRAARSGLTGSCAVWSASGPHSISQTPGRAGPQRRQGHRLRGP
jgi:MmyB-like transcription regulator ligand binding domain